MPSIMFIVIPPMIFHNHTLKIEEFSWNRSALAYGIYIMCTLSIKLCSTSSIVPSCAFIFWISSDVKITWFCSLPLFSHAPPPKLLLKVHLQLFGIWSFFHDLQGKLKVKEFAIGVRSCSASGNILSWPLFFIRTFPLSLSLALFNALCLSPQP